MCMCTPCHCVVQCTSMYISHPSMSVHSSHLQVTPPESVRGRYYHSITATSLGPGLSEVVMFGGQLKYWGDPIAETTVLRFGEGVDTVQWRIQLGAQGASAPPWQLPFTIKLTFYSFLNSKSSSKPSFRP